MHRDKTLFIFESADLVAPAYYTKPHAELAVRDVDGGDPEVHKAQLVAKLDLHDGAPLCVYQRGESHLSTPDLDKVRDE